MTKHQPKKRVDIVSLQLVKEASTMYAARRCSNPEALYQLFAPFIEKKDREHMIVAGLNTKGEPTFIHIAHIGTVNQALAFPRDILKPALLSNSVSICVGHNHPAGSTDASLADIEFTSKLEKACKLLQIRLQDHLIIASSGEYLSMRAEGYINDGATS